MKAVKAKTTKTAPKVAAKATLKGKAVKAAPKESAVKGKVAKGKKPKKVLPKGTPMSLDDTLWRLVNRPIAPKKPAPAAKEKAHTEDDAS
jgi:hypothetical protein